MSFIEDEEAFGVFAGGPGEAEAVPSQMIQEEAEQTGERMLEEALQTGRLRSARQEPPRRSPGDQGGLQAGGVRDRHPQRRGRLHPRDPQAQRLGRSQARAAAACPRVQVLAGPFPEESHRLHRQRRKRPRGCAHLGRQDRSRRVRHRDGSPRQAARDLHLADQGPEQPEVPRAPRDLQRRRPDHRRRHAEPELFLSRDDHRDPPQHALPRLRDRQRDLLGHLRRGALHARPRARRRLGRDHDPLLAEHPLRLPLGHHPQRARLRRVDLQDQAPALPRGLHRLPPRAAAALHLPGRGRRHLPDRRREGQVPRGQLQESAQLDEFGRGVLHQRPAEGHEEHGRLGPEQDHQADRGEEAQPRHRLLLQQARSGRLRDVDAEARPHHRRRERHHRHHVLQRDELAQLRRQRTHPDPADAPHTQARHRHPPRRPPPHRQRNHRNPLLPRPPQNPLLH